MQLILEKGLYSQFAVILEYPHENITGLIKGCIKLLEDAPQYAPLAREEMEACLEKVEGMSLDDLQGIFLVYMRDGRRYNAGARILHV